VFFFFFQAEDGIRDFHVTGVQTCALPISASFLIQSSLTPSFFASRSARTSGVPPTCRPTVGGRSSGSSSAKRHSVCGRRENSSRSEERRVGKECRSGGVTDR